MRCRQPLDWGCRVLQAEPLPDDAGPRKKPKKVFPVTESAEVAAPLHMKLDRRHTNWGQLPDMVLLTVLRQCEPELEKADLNFRMKHSVSSLKTAGGPLLEIASCLLACLFFLGYSRHKIHGQQSSGHAAS